MDVGRRCLILRMSSLGDIILSSSALQVKSNTSLTFDWVVAHEYQEVLKNNPKINQLWAFDRSKKSYQGLLAWIRFCRILWESRYDEVYDLHNNLRTLLLKILFIIFGILKAERLPQWRSVSKQRVRLYGYFFFKEIWPKNWRPTPWIERFTRLLGGIGQERPDLRYLLSNLSKEKEKDEAILREKAMGKRIISVMPSSQWRGKNWPVQKYAELLKLKENTFFPIILGTKKDRESLQLSQLLEANQTPHYSLVSVDDAEQRTFPLSKTAFFLSCSVTYLGGDTGLAHLAEALGVPASVIYGPTTPSMGFAPWKEESQAISYSLWCRPCGKEGRSCFRIKNRYQCLKELSVVEACHQLKVRDSQ